MTAIKEVLGMARQKGGEGTFRTEAQKQANSPNQERARAKALGFTVPSETLPGTRSLGIKW